MALGPWSTIAKYLASDGYDEEEIERIVEIAQSQGLDAMLIDRVLGTNERKCSLRRCCEWRYGMHCVRRS